MKDLWSLLIDAQNSETGLPEVLLKEKESELKAKSEKNIEKVLFLEKMLKEKETKLDSDEPKREDKNEKLSATDLHISNAKSTEELKDRSDSKFQKSHHVKYKSDRENGIRDKERRHDYHHSRRRSRSYDKRSRSHDRSRSRSRNKNRKRTENRDRHGNKYRDDRHDDRDKHHRRDKNERL
jgi:hypothetical protein